MSEQRLINPKSLRSRFEYYASHSVVGSDAEYAYKTAIREVDAQLTIDPETLPIVKELRVRLAKCEPVVRANWISDPVYGNDIASGVLDDDEFLKHYRCSRCGRRVSCLVGKNISEELPYCHCGAKMNSYKEQ